MKLNICVRMVIVALVVPRFLAATPSICFEMTRWHSFTLPANTREVRRRRSKTGIQPLGVFVLLVDRETRAFTFHSCFIGSWIAKVPRNGFCSGVKEFNLEEPFGGPQNKFRLPLLKVRKAAAPRLFLRRACESTR